VVALDDTALEQMLAEAVAAWPGIRLAPERFREGVARALDDGVPPDALHASDLYLALACLAGVPEAIEAFHAKILEPVRPSIVRAVAQKLDAEDAVQATLEKLLVGPEPKLAQYTGRGALVGWVRVVGVRAALEAKRRTVREIPSDDAALLAKDGGRDPSIDLAMLRAKHGPAFRAAVQQALRRLDVEQRTLLRMHASDGLSIDRIAPMLGIHRATAARRLEKARSDALEETRAILQVESGLSASEARSLCIALAPEVDVSIGRALAMDPP
jgi:RNA polymerase sigma-70 factor (ECF subfamily)